MELATSTIPTFQKIYDAIGSTGLLAVIAFLGGSLFTAALNHFLTRRRLGEERAIQFNKEKFFALQQKAEELLDGLHITAQRMREWEVFAHMDDAEFKARIAHAEFNNDFKKERLHIPTLLSLYFPSVSKSDYNESMRLVNETGKLMLQRIEYGRLTGGDWNQLLGNFQHFWTNMSSLEDKIKETLDTEEKYIAGN